MTVRQYYLHIRSIGQFPAMDALREAREAAALDELTRLKKGRSGPTLAHYEIWPDGSVPICLSFAIKVF